jgi:hypothetical protein
MTEPVRPEVREITPRDAARRQYLLEYERLCEVEQMQQLLGNDDEAQDAHWGACVALRAWDGELIPPGVDR